MNIEKGITFKLLQNTYKIEFPNTGEYMDILSRRELLTSGQYRSISLGSSYNKDLIDAITLFSILVPDMKKTLNVDSIFDLDLVRSKEIVKTYRKDVKKWYQDMLDFLNLADEEEEKKS